MIKLSRFCLFLALSLGSTLASAAVLFDRGLPNTVNANNETIVVPSPPTTARSNVSWGNQDGFINGDNFQVPVGEDWTITQISTWMVGMPGNYSGFTLYGGVAGGPFDIISTTASTSQVYYQPPPGLPPCGSASGASYLINGGGCLEIHKVTFDVNNIHLTSGTTYNFAPDAAPSGSCEVGGDTTGCFYVHATNAALAGTPQPGSDNKYISFDTLALPGEGDPQFVDSNGNGWDKSSDINVLVEGTSSAVPEPSMIPFLLIGIVAIGAIRRRK